jgi:hypothetical protein
MLMYNADINANFLKKMAAPRATPESATLPFFFSHIYSNTAPSKRYTSPEIFY